VNRASDFHKRPRPKLTLFIYLKSRTGGKPGKKTLPKLNHIDEADLKKIILSERPLQVSRKLILGKLSLQKVSPYRIAGPASATFYGRSDLINRITGSAGSFTIVGARKIGKSSLLHKIKKPRPGDHLYLYGPGVRILKCQKLRHLFKSLQSALEKRFQRKSISGSSLSRGFLQIIAHHPRDIAGGQKIVFIFDEIDGLIRFDQKRISNSSAYFAPCPNGLL